MEALTSLRRSFGFLAAGQAVGRLFTFGTTLYLARVLGAEPFGALTFAIAVVAYAAVIVDFGFDALGPVEMARRGASPAALVGTVMTVRLGLAAAAVSALAAFAFVAPLDPTTVRLLLVFGLSLPIAALDLRWALLGTESMAAVAAAEVVLQAVPMMGALLFVRGPGDLWIVPLTLVAAQGACAAAGWAAWAARWGWPRLGTDRDLARTLLSAAFPLVGSAAVGVLLHNFDLVLIGLWLGLGPAGRYGAAARVVWLPTVLLVAYTAAVRPTIVRAHAEGPSMVEVVVSRSHRLMAVAGLGGAVGGAILARPLLEALYGSAYTAGAPALRVLLAALLLMVFSRPYRVLLVAARKQGWDFRILLAAAVVNVAGNVAFLPRLGLLGAALATLASEALLLALAHAAVRRLAPGIGLVRHLVRPALCAGVMAALLIATPSWPLVARVAAGAACYAALVLALRLVDLRPVDGVV